MFDFSLALSTWQCWRSKWVSPEGLAGDGCSCWCSIIAHDCLLPDDGLLLVSWSFIDDHAPLIHLNSYTVYIGKSTLVTYYVWIYIYFLWDMVWLFPIVHSCSVFRCKKKLGKFKVSAQRGTLDPKTILESAEGLEMKSVENSLLSVSVDAAWSCKVISVNLCVWNVLIC